MGEDRVSNEKANGRVQIHEVTAERFTKKMKLRSSNDTIVFF